jgi:anionic cell wall polymer biosynthesis LytR-Cps2A-Psr (LCP) family protein
MGIDDREIIDYEGTGKNNQASADLILLAVFNKETKTYSLLQINRDTMCDMMTYDYFGTYAGMVHKQICLSHIYRSKHEDACEDTKFAVSHLLFDIEISNYFALAMDAIPIINDSVGGVTVTIEDDFSQIDESLVRGQTVTLMGDQAETYVRSRGAVTNSPTNLNRMSRQSKYMSALLPMLGQRTAESSSFAYSLFDKLSPYMITDCDYDQLTEYITQFSGYTLDKIVTPDGEAVVGEDEHMEFHIDDSSLRGIIIDLFYVKAD